MRSTVYGRGAAPAWDIARPLRPSRVDGAALAAFRSRSAGPVEMPVVPHPAITLVVELGDGTLTVEGTDGRQRCGSLVAGLMSEAVRMRGENIACVEVRLSPLVAPAVLGVSPVELDGSTVALDDVWGREAAQVREQLGDAPSWEDRFVLIDALLARRRATGPTVDPEVAWGWERIVASRGRVRVEDLAVETGWSRKRLWGRFRSQIGLPPKRAARLVRFHHAARRLASGEAVSRIAAECGYVDQSHLHREVLGFTAMAPTTLAAAPGLKADTVAWAGHDGPAS